MAIRDPYDWPKDWCRQPFWQQKSKTASALPVWPLFWPELPLNLLPKKRFCGVSDESCCNINMIAQVVRALLNDGMYFAN